MGGGGGDSIPCCIYDIITAGCQFHGGIDQ